jgi:hypothetical protein
LDNVRVELAPKQLPEPPKVPSRRVLMAMFAAPSAAAVSLTWFRSAIVDFMLVSANARTVMTTSDTTVMKTSASTSEVPRSSYGRMQNRLGVMSVSAVQ